MIKLYLAQKRSFDTPEETPLAFFHRVYEESNVGDDHLLRDYLNEIEFNSFEFEYVRNYAHLVAFVPDEIAIQIVMVVPELYELLLLPIL